MIPPDHEIQLKKEEDHNRDLENDNIIEENPLDMSNDATNHITASDEESDISIDFGFPFVDDELNNLWVRLPSEWLDYSW